MNFPRPLLTSLFPGLLLGLLAAGGCSEPESPPFTTAEPRAFVSTLGSDTMSVEVYTRSGDILEGTIVGRRPSTHMVDYSVTFGSDDTIDRLEAVNTSFDSSGRARIESRWSIDIADTLATIMLAESSKSDTFRVPVSRDAVPTLGRLPSSIFVFEQLASQLRRADAGHSAGAGQAATAPLQLLSPTSPQPRLNTAVLISSDSVAMDFFGSPRVAWMSPEGMILGASGAATTVKEETRRVPVDEMDLDALAERWALMDAAGNGIGNPSPAAMVTTTVDNAEIEITYSQPAVRGRTIWGELVPYGTVWRTGANAATQLTIGRPLRFEGLELPSASYTLWTTFSEDGGTLIFNTETGQWGTEYDPDRDVGRVPLIRSETSAHVERFTISAVDTPDGGELRFEWDRTRWSAPFTVGQ